MKKTIITASLILFFAIIISKKIDVNNKQLILAKKENTEKIKNDNLQKCIKKAENKYSTFINMNSVKSSTDGTMIITRKLFKHANQNMQQDKIDCIRLYK